ncbi:MAG: hypothetical protein IJP38_04635 [Oscillospiraceae bacterium]|nr:hypothetical protein [Oscillospiraceae bacterium]
MSEKKHAFLYVGIPLIVGVATGIAFIICFFLEFPTNQRGIYSLLLFSALISSIFAPIPCCILSILGIKKLVKLKKQGEKHLELPILIGIINIVAWVAVGALWWYVIFIGGRGV